MAAEQGEASAQVQPRSHVRTGPHVHGLELPGLRAVSKRIESTYIWQGGAGSARSWSAPAHLHSARIVTEHVFILQSLC